MTTVRALVNCDRSARGSSAFHRRLFQGFMATASVALLLLALGGFSFAGPVTISSQMGNSPAIEIDAGLRSILEVNQAIKSFENRQFGECIELLGRARKTHPELPPCHALFAKLAFLSGQRALIRPARTGGG